MDKNYDHKNFEDQIYQNWEESGAFVPRESNETFSIIMPPPNANDPLHVGHAMFVTIEDILIRYHRMKGDATLWLPGTDHAGIETQFVFEKKLAKQDKSRFDFDRDTLYKMIWDYVQENSGVAVDQMKRLGASADWSRFKFTLDPGIVDSVLDTFIKLHDDNLIYRGEKLINYCTKCGTGYSELEVEHEDRIDALYYIRYPLVSDNKQFIVVATTRPEPIWADTHLAVHPNDKKTKQLIGQKVFNPLTGQEMEIIADEFVDPEFGTGIVKLTPAHDFNDYEVAQKHNLPVIHAINTQGRLIGGPFADSKVTEGRKKTIELLQEKGLVDHIDDKYLHRVGVCYRCHSILEPLPLPQFFIKTRSLADRALKSLDKKETKILGAGRDKILQHWLENIHDWNISRQIVWGIRMPIWYEIETGAKNISVWWLDQNKTLSQGEIGEFLDKGVLLEDIETGIQKVLALPLPNSPKWVVSKTKPEDGKQYIQETDTFDTWFSSGQWPVVTLQNSNKDDFKHFYPTSVMETGYDILPIWVMRMMLLGIYMTGKSPFEWVYLHGLIRDEKGLKMSKSKGNVINPLDMVDKYGADALRMALVISSTPGQDKAVGENTIRGMRNFSNKIWNAARFVQTYEGTADINTDFEDWYTKFVPSAMSKHLNDLRVGQAAEFIYNEFWHSFCDKYIEVAKQGKIGSIQLKEGLATLLKLLHPFVPFVTEAVWKELSLPGLLISSSWPE